jgi:hypothetical protein
MFVQWQIPEHQKCDSQVLKTLKLVLSKELSSAQIGLEVASWSLEP